MLRHFAAHNFMTLSHGMRTSFGLTGVLCGLPPFYRHVAFCRGSFWRCFGLCSARLLRFLFVPCVFVWELLLPVVCVEWARALHLAVCATKPSSGCGSRGLLGDGGRVWCRHDSSHLFQVLLVLHFVQWILLLISLCFQVSSGVCCTCFSGATFLVRFPDILLNVRHGNGTV